MDADKHTEGNETTGPLNAMANNVESIVRLEESELRERTRGERLSDAITVFIGSTKAVVLHLAVFAAWVIVNLDFIPGVRAFDPFPFGILTLIFSGEGVFLSIFILISQNHMTRQADRRAHLDLQISILAEQELTMILRLQQRLCRHLGLEVEDAREELQEMVRPTDVEQIVTHIKEKLPAE